VAEKCRKSEYGRERERERKREKRKTAALWEFEERGNGT